MILIADSGSTKTDWALVGQEGVAGRFATQGINPVHQDAAAIAAILKGELLPQLQASPGSEHNSGCRFQTFQEVSISSIAFYGSGCLPSLQPLVVQLLREALPSAADVEVQGDLLGAARALCGSREGIACILGTGANSCLYDGSRIVKNTSPLGYVLGDEGSGAVLGISFLNALLKGFLPAELKAAFLEWQQMTEADIIGRVYRQPLANRWLASLSPFIHEHLEMPAVSEIVTENFRRFFRRNLVQYGRCDLPVQAVGSIAWHYRDQLAAAARAEGFTLGTVVATPMDGLVAFHQKR